MPLEKQVVSLDLAKRLKELGVKQESVWYWVYFDGMSKWIVEPDLFYGDKKVERYSAFTVVELYALLKPYMSGELVIPWSTEPDHLADELAAKLVKTLLTNQ